MSTLVLDFWNYVPEEILAHIFSFLPLEDTHTAFSICQCWAAVASVHSVWKFTEIDCNTEEMYKKCLLQRLQQFLSHIEHLKIVLDLSGEVNQRHAIQILYMLTWQRHKVRALSIECCGETPYTCSGPDILYTFRLCLLRGRLDLQYIDFRCTPFPLNNELVQLIATSSPNLHTLLINKAASGINHLEPETIAEVLQTCPKLSVLGVQHATLSEEVFQELLKPSRGPLHFLDIYCEDLRWYIPEELWSALTEKHPQLRVGFYFGLTVPRWIVPLILMPDIPIAALQFNIFTNMVRPIQLVSETTVGHWRGWSLTPTHLTSSMPRSYSWPRNVCI